MEFMQAERHRAREKACDIHQLNMVEKKKENKSSTKAT